jgi:hypothetical protein
MEILAMLVYWMFPKLVESRSFLRHVSFSCGAGVEAKFDFVVVDLSGTPRGTSVGCGWALV